MKFVGLKLEDEKKYTCRECGKAYKSAEALEKHVAEKHAEKAPPEE